MEPGECRRDSLVGDDTGTDLRSSGFDHGRGSGFGQTTVIPYSVTNRGVVALGNSSTSLTATTTGVNASPAAPVQSTSSTATGTTAAGSSPGTAPTRAASGGGSASTPSASR